MRLILASGSPRRRELLGVMGLDFEVVVAGVDESVVTVLDPAVNVVERARLKGVAVARDVVGSAIVIASDTTVAVDGVMLNKPVDEVEAGVMLRRLRGRVHEVYTGLVLIETGTGRVVTDVAVVDVPMRDYSDVEIEAYIATGDPMDKAGAYAIQHAGFRPVVAISDCFAGVMGLPLCHLTRSLRRLGVVVGGDVAGACQVYLDYGCGVFAGILSAC